MSNDLRESSFSLLSDLCQRSDLPADSLRIVSHSLLNLASDAGTESISEVMRALPWFAALLDWENGTSSEELAESLVGRGAARALSTPFIAARIAAFETSPTRRFSREQSGGRAALLKHLAGLDQSLVELSMKPASAVKSAVLNDVALLRAVVELAGTSMLPETAQRLIHALQFDRTSSQLAASLAILEDLETSWNGGRIVEFEGLGERSRRFEMSSVDHLRKNDVLIAVRAAMVARASTIDSGEWLHSVPELRAKPELESLAIALEHTRGRALRVVSGASTLLTMNPWLTYLTGPCVDLAEAKELTLREAMSFAHFSLHLLNFCDLLAFHPEAANDQVRKSLMDVEDELKEVSIAAQRQDRSDIAVNLSRYSELKWRRISARERVADRLARLGGGWRVGLQSAPIGAAARLAAPHVESELDTLHALEADLPGAADVLANLLSRAEFEGQSVFEQLELEQRFALITTALTMARDLDSIDVSKAFVIDLSALSRWSDTNPPEVFNHVLLGLPIVAAIAGVQGTQGPVVSRLEGSNRICIEFSPPERMQATLMLLADTSIGGLLRAELQRSLLEVSSEAAETTLPVEWQ